ncbi:DUF1549 and DUF1553 domain-containing protein [Tautonia sociabilis]|uniref:DUF1553 domain-containing protein n=1 Tax=Tautonia sociabilis TaxID=2080755 RepID=A0A432MQJ7_9BACT|nr:DUF1549 and DUF1553 domain-containing protein [Tautonia sociabilis]RUL89326.1 DUF1553 domain-containing protein [Tautonia sociabilis]
MRLTAILIPFVILATSAAADGEDHWAFLPPERPEVPAVGDDSWPRNPIDRFILAGLEGFGVRPAPEADRPALLRRLSFDLTGLPPTPEQVNSFLSDPAPDAYERQVDRLLASPHYGERMAQHWLDLARYADTDGFEFDQTRPAMWRYRDWVVSALNEDLPYDRFVALQMAGDELEPEDPSATVATGFHRCYPDMVDMNDQGERRQLALDDITETTGLVFLGLTIGCAKCHDHKFDPISQVDYFRLQAFFTPSRFEDEFTVATEEHRAEHEAARRRWERQVAALRSALLRLEHEARERIAPGPPPGLTREAKAALEKWEAERSPGETAMVFEAIMGDPRVEPDRLAEELGPEALARRNELREQLDRAEQAEPPPLPRARVLVESSPEAGPTHVLIRGQYGRDGPEVEPGFPAALPGGEESPPITPGRRSTGRRSVLAAWLTRPEHPLTGRVIVNRLWQQHFGRGIVASPSDFGTMGNLPSHPDLLDWLASELPRRGWSLKAMHRLIVTSSSYRMSSRFDSKAHAIDPENELFWRQDRRRLDGEAIRDAMLAASCALNPELGGPPIFPELPPELTKLSSKGAIWPVSSEARQRNRRSLYVFVRRNLRYPFFEAFDRPDTNASCPRRAETIIAPQALALLNDRLAFDAAQGLAARLEREAGPENADRIELAYLLALGRTPDTEERRLAVEFLGDGGERAWIAFCLALFNLNEFVFLD